MKALTLTQPWATLVILGIKQWETRGWYPGAEYQHPGQRFAIHAAKGWTRDDREFAAELHARGILPVLPADLPRGAVLGTVRFDGLCRTTSRMAEELSDLEQELGDYSPGRYAWEFANPQPLLEPVPARGALGLWNWAPTP
jgi:hypothetical protein